MKKIASIVLMSCLAFSILLEFIYKGSSNIDKPVLQIFHFLTIAILSGIGFNTLMGIINNPNE